MKLSYRLAGLVLTAALTTSCGYYTNIPAQIKVSTTQSNVATVTYSASGDSVAAEVKNPVIALEGEPGSIGVTYNKITIDYLPESLQLNPRKVVITGSIRVPSSHQFDENNKVVVGRVETELPIISVQIVQLGSPGSQTRITSQISARVTLEGTDDAGFPASKELFVPINFVSTSNG